MREMPRVMRTILILLYALFRLLVELDLGSEGWVGWKWGGRTFWSGFVSFDYEDIILW